MRVAYKYRTRLSTSMGLLVAAVDKGQTQPVPEIVKTEDCQPLVSTVLPCFPLATIAVNLGVSLAERGFAKTNPMKGQRRVPQACVHSVFRAFWRG